MSTLAAGVLLWCLVHLFPAMLPDARASIASRLGEKPFRGVFAGLILVSLALIVVGWRSVEVTLVYSPPFTGGVLVPLLLFVAFYLVTAANIPGKTRRLLRHPMLLGTVLWGVAHLLANGENRSMILFGGLSAWALLEMILINRRDRHNAPPDAAAASRDLLTLVVTVIVYGSVLYLHPLLFGVPALPGL